MSTDCRSLPSTFLLEMSITAAIAAYIQRGTTTLLMIAGRRSCTGCLMAISFLVLALPTPFAEVPGQARTTIDRIMGNKGTYIDSEGVYKVLMPRGDATIVQDYQTFSQNLGLNSWAAFTSAVHHPALLTGQLLLREDEVTPVLSAALQNGLEVTGLADCSVIAGPRLKTLDVTGAGSFQGLAIAFHNAYAQIRRVRSEATLHSSKFFLPDVQLDSSISPDPLNNILSTRGSMADGVYKATIGRHGLLHGEMIGREMGFATWIAFAGTDKRALAQGEFVATPDELQSLLKALIAKKIEIVSVRNHTVGEHPQYLFVRFWRQGVAAEVAKDVRYALNVQVGILPAPIVGKAL
ncbi:MAG: DUF1259 domain-containing protein [Acidobacteriales bacterium]|nr:DUF1259 domain-containing protein [Terriglobales bacterium]